MPGMDKCRLFTHHDAALKEPENNSARTSKATTVAEARVRRNWLVAICLIVLAAFAAYHNSFSGPFIFDDDMGIVENPTIHRISFATLAPPRGGYTVSGRPLLNLSLAINYAISGTNVWSYHVFNFIIHLFAALALFGIVRRTLLKPRLRERFGSAALFLATVVAILWAVHPLQTEAVTYIIQRAESLMGLFYLLAIYCFIRGTEARPKLWYPLAVVACLCGIGTKEVAVTAPLMILLYDRTFLAGTFFGALKIRRRVYAGLAATWLLLGLLLVANKAFVSGGAGFDAPISWWRYAITEFWAVAHYLWLSIWPHPLILDYGGKVLISGTHALPYAVLIVMLLILTGVAVLRWPAIGFAGCWFFGILALTSTVLPLGDTVFEHRIYLSLAAVIALIVLALYKWLRRWSAVPLAAMALACIVLSSRRNEDYRSKISIWSDTVAKCPTSARAQATLGGVLMDEGRFDEAEARYRRALQINPNYAAAYNNLGGLFAKERRFDEAIAEYRKSLRIEPNRADALNNLGSALAAEKRFDEAIGLYRRALELNPNEAEVYYNLGNAFVSQKKFDAAADAYSKAVWLNPAHPFANNNLGNIRTERGQIDEAIKNYRAAVKAKPDFAEAHNNLGNALSQKGRLDEAAAQYEDAIRLSPRFASARVQLGNVFLAQGKTAQAINSYRKALELEPGNPEARKNLAMAEASGGTTVDYNARGNGLLNSGRVDEAIESYRKAIELKPNDAEAHSNLGVALAMKQKNEEATREFSESLRIEPSSASTHNNFASLLEQSGRLLEAAEHFEIAAKLAPKEADAQFQAGRVLARLGKEKEAAPYLKAALQLKPDFAEARELLDTLKN